MDNQVYVYHEQLLSWEEIKEFPNGQLDEAMTYGYKLAYADKKKKYAVLTEGGKFLRLNTIIIA